MTAIAAQGPLGHENVLATIEWPVWSNPQIERRLWRKNPSGRSWPGLARETCSS
jgi:hypothetical protein